MELNGIRMYKSVMLGRVFSTFSQTPLTIAALTTIFALALSGSLNDTFLCSQSKAQTNSDSLDQVSWCSVGGRGGRRLHAGGSQNGSRYPVRIKAD